MYFGFVVLIGILNMDDINKRIYNIEIEMFIIIGLIESVCE